MFMTTALVDTHRLIKDLTTSFGFSEKQAEGVAEAIRRIDLSNLVTKGDLKEALQGLEMRLDRRISSIIILFIPLLVGQAAVFAAIASWMK